MYLGQGFDDYISERLKRFFYDKTEIHR